MEKQEFLTHIQSIEALFEFVEINDAESIVSIVSGVMAIDPVRLINAPMGGYSRLINDDGSFSKGNGCYIYSLYDVKQNLKEYRYAYSLLCDDISREVFFCQMRYRILPITEFLQAAYSVSAKYPQYFDEDIYRTAEGEVIVDCGGYIGDTTELLAKHFEKYKRIYVYEPLLENYNKCLVNLADYKNIVLRKAGVGRKSTSMKFDGDGSAGSFLSFVSNDDDDVNKIDVVSLDEDIKEPISFIKMDVECFELDAINGAARHIKNESPKLAICLYHMFSDLWEIPKLIDTINPNYDYYLRHYHNEHNWEYVLYAVPGSSGAVVRDVQARTASVHDRELTDFLLETEPYLEKLEELSLETAAELYDLLDGAAYAATNHISNIDTQLRAEICSRQDIVLERIVDEMPPFEHTGEPLGIYSPAINGYRHWESVELMKDCGLVPYMLAKELSAIPVMYFGSKPEDYPYLSYLPEMKMLYHNAETGLEDAYKDVLSNDYHKMDVLIFYGLYKNTPGYLDAYRKLRPDGKVFCGLDMNYWWMEKISWDSFPVKVFSMQCDVLATSCRPVRDALNRNPKVHFPCHWLPNGFYNPTGLQTIADPELKENIIITVGRIGTQQKRNEELLSAFAQISDRISEWSLRLIGPIEPEFMQYIENFFSQYPHLKDRVTFTGQIADKEKLYSEYAKAKIFALTSWAEGMPNAYAEALIHGCMFITSDINAADDITNYGELGLCYVRADVDALSSAIEKTCAKADKRGMQEHIPKALKYAAKYYDWNRNAKKLAYMLFK